LQLGEEPQVAGLVRLLVVHGAAVQGAVRLDRRHHADLDVLDELIKLLRALMVAVVVVHVSSPRTEG